MDRRVLWIVLGIFLALFGFKQNQSEDFDGVRAGFVNPPDSVRLTTFYYWINNHISKDGVIKDLHAMKEAGITRVFIGSNIRNRTSWSRDTSGMWFGNVKVFSQDWWDVLHTALKTAAALDIEVGLFNCPGWSQSGGPWIKPDQAMRYLDASQVRIKGAGKIRLQLIKPDTFFQDVKVLAIKVQPSYQKNLLETKGSTLTPINIEKKSNIANGRSYVLTGKKGQIDISLPATQTIRSLTIIPGEFLNAHFELQVLTDSGYKRVKKADILRSKKVEDLAKGFEPAAPFFISLASINGRNFRIFFDKIGNSESVIDSVILSGTPIIDNLPEKKLAKVVASSPSWTGSNKVQGVIKQPLFSVPSTSDVLDISKHMTADGMLEWSAPKGEWIILRTGMRFINVQNGPASFEAEGLEVDKLNSKHVEMHFNTFIGEILKRIPAADRTSLKMVVMDSYERGGSNFTDDFLAAFKKRYGYDATPFLPVYAGHIIVDKFTSDRFLWDVRRLVADKLSYDYIGAMRKISHANGLRIWLENYGHSGYPGEFMQYGGQSDEVAGEYWVEPLSDKRFENRGAASTAHTYGKNKVWSESFTSGSWTQSFEYSTYPQQLKALGDQAFTQGVNSSVLHLYIQQPYENIYPGVDAWFGTEFNRKNTWFKHMDLFSLYHRRCNFMLQQGKNIADIAYYIGEDNPIMKGSLEPALPKGYNYDYINAEVILRDLQVRDGQFFLPNGTTYKVLVLPGQQTMRPEVIVKIASLVKDGGVILGSPPSRSPSLQDYPRADQIVSSTASEIWNQKDNKHIRYGRGHVFQKSSLSDVLRAINVQPDLIADHPSVEFSHRRINGKDIYFIANLSAEQIRFNASFRVSGMQPELWDPLNGETRKLPSFKAGQGVENIPLQLSPNGSAFIVFAGKGQLPKMVSTTNFQEPSVLYTISTPWKVSFEHDKVKRGPAEPIYMDKLIDWSKHEDNRIRYYSGVVVYQNNFIIEKTTSTQAYYIDLGKLTATAKIKVNGIDVGGAWTFPYRVNVSKAIKQGKNFLEIEVINTWRNRIIGDSELSKKDRIVHSRIGPGNTSKVLQSSGLLGPVSLISVKNEQ